LGQVVGHAKTCLVLTGGYIMFPAAAGDLQRLYNNIAGVSVAMLGVILYGHLQQARRTPSQR
jgi:solute carrier family 35 protein E3